VLQKFERVLIVDDDLSQAPLWDIILARHSENAQVEWTVSSEEARRLIRETSEKNENQFDLIVADLFLAGSDTGIEFLTCDEVKSLGAKTILVSAVEKNKLEDHCREVLPETKVITKPLNVVKCERALAQLSGEEEQ